MKLRILHDSIRMRLDREEVDRVSMGERVECVTHFPGGAALCYRLGIGERYSASFGEQGIDVVVPADVARHWAATDSEVSLGGRLELAAGELALLVEKDFECLEPRAGEDQRNRFPNPKA